MRLLCDVLLDLGDVRRMCEQRQPLDFAERLCRLAARLAGAGRHDHDRRRRPAPGPVLLPHGADRRRRDRRPAPARPGWPSASPWSRCTTATRRRPPRSPGPGGDLAGRNACVAGVMAPVMEARALARLASGWQRRPRGAGPGPRRRLGPGPTRRSAGWPGEAPERATPPSATPSASFSSTRATRWSPWAITGARRRAFEQVAAAVLGGRDPGPVAGHARPGPVPARGRRAGGGAAAEPGHPARRCPASTARASWCAPPGRWASRSPRSTATSAPCASTARRW